MPPDLTRTFAGEVRQCPEGVLLEGVRGCAAEAASSFAKSAAC